MKQPSWLKSLDMRELKLPETSYVRDIETKVFQAIVLQCLSKIQGIFLLGGGLVDHFLARDQADKMKGIYVEQDQKNHSLSVRVEVNIAYGLSIPEKAEEIQSKITEEMSSLTGLHVSCVHVVFKGLIVEQEHPKTPSTSSSLPETKTDKTQEEKKQKALV